MNSDVKQGAGGGTGDERLIALLDRIAGALERLAPPPSETVQALPAVTACVWQRDGARLLPVPAVNRVDLSLLRGIDRQRDTLLTNTQRFAAGLPANNALLWGARGMGKSSLVKAVHGTVERHHPGLMLVEIHREDLESLPCLLARIRDQSRPDQSRRCILFCDDLSFDGQDSQYKSLKAVLEGGLEGRPANVVFYATSNRRHLMPRDMVENEASTALNPSDSVEEKVSLSDRFGLWLGFHGCDQETFFAMVEGYAAYHGLAVDAEALRREAVEWAITRGGRSGRVAWQFIQDVAGRLRVRL